MMVRRTETTGRIVRIAAVALLGFFMVGAGFRLVDGPVNAATRADLSQQVSNLPCGPLTNVTCPGRLRCLAGTAGPHPSSNRSYGFLKERVGVHVGPRCVTPTYVTGYCGFFESTVVVGGAVSTCHSVSVYSPLPLDPLPYIDALLHREPGLIEQLRNPNNDGTALIHSYNLTLAKEDPDASQTNVTPPDSWDLGIIRDAGAPDQP